MLPQDLQKNSTSTQYNTIVFSILKLNKPVVEEEVVVVVVVVVVVFNTVETRQDGRIV